MKNTISLDAKTVELILTRLEKLVNDVQTIKKALFDEEPPYGSDEWWEWSDKKAVEEIKAGQYTEIRTKKGLQTFLDSLKKS